MKWMELQDKMTHIVLQQQSVWKSTTYKRKREGNSIKREIIVNESLIQIVYVHFPNVLSAYLFSRLHAK